MKTESVVFMAISWLCVLSLVGWCYWRILRKPAPGPAQLEPVREETPPER